VKAKPKALLPVVLCPVPSVISAGWYNKPRVTTFRCDATLGPLEAAGHSQDSHFQQNQQLVC
jgi:hypothetical protein